ncbi:MAG: hypothetical protein DHS80DRAFT_33029 [Piptocephalis tieghemiana]|nr:MAG: hypothetical protein DHS80DRAFT_33029 [Piptocephalis tieghemiana]
MACAQPEYDYLTEPPEDLQCPICTDAYIAPVQITRSEDVIDAIQLGQRTDALLIRCKEAPACDWQGPRRSVAHHYAEECKVVRLVCGDDPRFAGCSRTLQRRALEEHRTQCSYRRELCPWECGFSVPYAQKESLLLHERTLCLQRPVVCGACGASTTSLHSSVSPPSAYPSNQGLLAGPSLPSPSSPPPQSISPSMAPAFPSVLPTSIAEEGSADGTSPSSDHSTVPIIPAPGHKTPPQSPPPFTTPLPSNQLRARDLSLHRQRECPATLVTCPHRRILGDRGGCMEVMARRDLAQHCFEECPWHSIQIPIQTLNHELTLLEQRIQRTDQMWRAKLKFLSTLTIHASNFPTNGYWAPPIPPRSPLLPSSPAQSLPPMHRPTSSGNGQPSQDTSQPQGSTGGLGIGMGGRDASPGRGVTSSESDGHTPMGRSSRIIGESQYPSGGAEVEGSSMTLGRGSISSGKGLQALWPPPPPPGAHGAEAMAKALRHHPLLHTLDLSSCTLGDRGAEVLTRTLKQLPHLQVLDLGRNGLRHAGIKMIMEWALLLPQLKTLTLSENDLSRPGLAIVAQTLPQLPALRTLRLQGCRLGGQGWSLFLASLFLPSCHLEELDLSGANLTDGEWMELTGYLSSGTHPPSCIRLAQHGMSPDLVQVIRRAQILGRKRTRLPGLGGGRSRSRRVRLPHSSRPMDASGLEGRVAPMPSQTYAPVMSDMQTVKKVMKHL